MKPWDWMSLPIRTLFSIVSTLITDIVVVYFAPQERIFFHRDFAWTGRRRFEGSRILRHPIRVGIGCPGQRTESATQTNRQTDKKTDKQNAELCRNISCFAEFRQNWVKPETDSIFGNAAILCKLLGI